jgi:hypothetical protein
MFLRPRSQHVIAFRCKTPEDFDYLLRGFVRTVNNFGKSTPDLTMMVDARKSQILERKMAKLFNRFVYINCAVLDLFK